MGRETKILLGLLATLGGVFLGVLSMKLLVPRPPAGAGPDVTVHHAAGADTELVEPPSFASREERPTTQQMGRVADDIVATAEGDAFPPVSPSPDQAEPPHPDATTGFGTTPSATRTTARGTSLHRDPSVTAATYETREGDLEPRAAAPAPPIMTGRVAAAEPLRPGAALAQGPDTTQRRMERAPAMDVHVTRPGDSWWQIAERAYGDGRLYRALFAWNRAIDPRVSLAPGTRLEIPPLSRLEAAWPRLIPTP